MNENQKQLNEILKNTVKTAERTRNIERNLAEFEKRYVEESSAQEQRIAKLEKKTQRNSLIISAAILVGLVIFTAFSTWIFGFV